MTDGKDCTEAASSNAPPAPHVVVIDSKPRLVAVARLADRYGHAEAATVVRQLAEAVGVQCRGGRIYLPRRHNSVARGWARFIQNLSLGGRYELQLVVGPMVDRAVATGASVTIAPELTAEIRARGSQPGSVEREYPHDHGDR